jgi:CRISPR-associated protein Cas2
MRVVEMAKDGRAIMVFSRRGDQGLDFKVHRHDWQPVDYDGMALMLRPREEAPQPAMRPGWSAASRRRRAKPK